MQESGLIEIIPLICTLALWGQYPVLSHPESLQGAPSVVAAVTEGLTMGILFPSWASSGLTIRVAVIWCPDGHNIFCLLIWQTVSFHSHMYERWDSPQGLWWTWQECKPSENAHTQPRRLWLLGEKSLSRRWGKVQVRKGAGERRESRYCWPRNSGDRSVREPSQVKVIKGSDKTSIN